MSDGLGARIEGVADFRIAVESLIGSMRRRVVRAALRDGANIIARNARQAAPVLRGSKPGRLSGTLKRSIRVFSSKEKNGRAGVIGVYIGVKGNTKRIRAAGGKSATNPHDPFYWWWQEFGFTATGRRKLRGGTRRRRAARATTGRQIPGKRFMRDAFSGSSGTALRLFEDRLGERISEANRRK
jgi:HK97 gp10 family phage protein